MHDLRSARGWFITMFALHKEIEKLKDSVDYRWREVDLSICRQINLRGSVDG